MLVDSVYRPGRYSEDQYGYNHSQPYSSTEGQEETVPVQLECISFLDYHVMSVNSGKLLKIMIEYAVIGSFIFYELL